jgi:hypothetical protein
MRTSLLLQRAVLAALLTAVSASASAQQPTVILFVGNSFLHGQYQPVRSYNVAGVIDENSALPAGTPRAEGAAGPYGGIPAIFKTLTEEAGLPYEVHSELVSGKTLQYHYENALPVIARKTWDVVVMHDLSTGPVPDTRGGDPERFTKYADLLERAIHAENSAAAIYLYETFPRADLTYPERGPYHGDSIEVMARDLHAGYAREFASNTHVRDVAPAGDAWMDAIHEGIAARNPAQVAPGTINLWGADSYHPSIYGAYLNALVIFRTVTGRDPRAFGQSERAAIALGIAPAMAVTLQGLAADVRRWPTDR